MKSKHYLGAALMAGTLLAGGAGRAAPAVLQKIVVSHGPRTGAGWAPAFAVIRRAGPARNAIPGGALPPTWVDNLSLNGQAFSETFIGTDPAGDQQTSVPVYIVPIDLVYGSVSQDPTAVQANGVSVIQNILNSPIFQSSIDYVQGGTDVGTTQYIDAFQRMNVWGVVGSTSPDYHLTLSPTVLPAQTLTVPSGSGQIINSGNAQGLILADINWFDQQIQGLTASLGIPPGALPLYIITNSYLAQGNSVSSCCIGGYHSVNGGTGQPYSASTYITTPGNFAQDVSALSHELGEWVDDPNTNNAVPSDCGAGAILEVGDPLENNPNYGGYAYTVGGVTWNLQDLATLEYFGAPSETTLNDWTTFQGENLAYCSAGG